MLQDSIFFCRKRVGIPLCLDKVGHERTNGTKGTLPYLGAPVHYVRPLPEALVG